MENRRKRIDFEVVTPRQIALKRIAKPNFKRAKIFCEDLVSIYMTKPVLILNRPIQIGFAVLSKYHMYNFHYNVSLQQFPSSKLLFTYTDSLAYEVISHDLYQGMAEIKDHFHYSEYLEGHFLKSMNIMEKVGKFKDECHGQLMLKFIGLRLKLYSLDYEREVYFDADGNEVDKPTATKRIVHASKNTAK